MGSPEYATGKVGQAIRFRGISEAVVCAFDTDVLWPACSVSLWACPAITGQDENSSLFNNNSSSSDFQIDLDGTTPGRYRYHGTIDVDLGPAATEWVHLVASCDGTQTSFYFNGLLVTAEDIADANFGRIAFGVNRGDSVWFNGLIDEARIYDRVLSDAEAAGLAGLTEPVVRAF